MSPRGQLGKPPDADGPASSCMWTLTVVGSLCGLAWWTVLTAALIFHFHLRLP